MTAVRNPGIKAPTRKTRGFLHTRSIGSAFSVLLSLIDKRNNPPTNKAFKRLGWSLPKAATPVYLQDRLDCKGIYFFKIVLLYSLQTRKSLLSSKMPTSPTINQSTSADVVSEQEVSLIALSIKFVLLLLFT